jgi:hypothetical protein
VRSATSRWGDRSGQNRVFKGVELHRRGLSGGAAVVRSPVEIAGTGRSGRYRRRLFGNLGETTATVPERVRGRDANSAGEVLRVSDRLISAFDRLESLYFNRNNRSPRSAL